jgi:CDP-glycerol glycerophosphotransferase
LLVREGSTDNSFPTRWQAVRTLPRRLIRWILDQLNALLPKREQILLHLYPDTDGSLPPLLEACHGTDARIVVLLTDPDSAVALRARTVLGERVAVCRRGSLEAAWHFLRSRYVIFTHPAVISGRLSPRQTLVNIWHGMPVKAEGRLDRPQAPVLANWTLASSEHFRPMVAEALGVPLASVVVLNSPRIEHMTRRHPDIWDKLGISRSGWDRVVVWMPTFRGRQPDQGGAGVNHAPLLSAEGIVRLADLLDRRRCLLVLRRHPYETQAAPLSVPGIMELTDSALEAAGAGVYDVLAEADGLITDASSVWLEYLALDRPIIIYFPDLASFVADRRLMLDPYEQWTPGPVLQTEGECLEALDAVANGIDRHGSRRRAVQRVLVGDDFAELSARVLALAGIHAEAPGYGVEGEKRIVGGASGR